MDLHDVYRHNVQNWAIAQEHPQSFQYTGHKLIIRTFFLDSEVFFLLCFRIPIFSDCKKLLLNCNYAT